MARARIGDDIGRAAIGAIAEIARQHGTDVGEASASVDRSTLALAVRYSLQLLAEQAPGATLEVRVQSKGPP
ncbi:MAG TPA: hypothetical protein VGE78_06695, partial [Agromyces sp.]